MNCDEFSERMHERLDDRMSVEGDRELRRHCRQCESCCAEMEAWKQIATVIPSQLADVRPTLHARISGSTGADPQQTSGSRLRTLSGSSVARTGFVAVAASALLAFTWLYHKAGSEPLAKLTERPPSDVALLNHESSRDDSQPSDTHRWQSGELNPVIWWQDVRNRDWISQTMPAVESVRDGVAPLGRSLMRAVSILTVGGGNPTS